MKLLTCFPLTGPLIQRLQAAVPEWTLVHADQDSVSEQIIDCDVFCGHAKHQQIDWTRVVEQGRLKWIQSSAAGLDHCMVPSVINSEILVSGCPGLFRDSVAEQTLALLYGLIRSMPAFYDAQQKKQFVRLPTDDLHGKTIGIVGFGGNGQRIAQLLKPLGNKILATERFIDEWKAATVLPEIDELLPASALQDLLRRSDVVIVTLPLDASTEKIFSHQQFQAMGEGCSDGAYFINVGRGRLVDEPALIEALQQRQVKAAGLDVTFFEPPQPDSPLWSEPRVSLSPHVGAQAGRRYELVVELLIENVRRYSAGQTLKNLVDKTVGFPLPKDRF